MPQNEELKTNSVVVQIGAHTPATLLGGTASPSAAHPILEPWAKDFSSRDILHSYLLVFIAVTSGTYELHQFGLDASISDRWFLWFLQRHSFSS